MFKKSIATALLVCSVPVMANAAWFLTTQVKSQGGTLDSPIEIGQVVTEGALTKSFAYDPLNPPAPLAASAFAVHPAAGNALSTFLLIDSSVATDGTPISNTRVLPAAFTPQDNHNYTVTATFKVQNVPVSADIDNGSVTPTKLGNIFYGYKLRSPLVFTFSPAFGSKVTAISNVPSGAAKYIPDVVNKKATVTFPVDYVFNDVSWLTATGLKMSATTQQVTTTVRTAAQTALPDADVTLSAQLAGPTLTSPVYTWQFVSGPGNVAKDLTTGGKLSIKDNYGTLDVTPGPGTFGTNNVSTEVNPVFHVPATGTNIGQYKFVLTITSPDLAKPLVSLATVNVVATSADKSNVCVTCHSRIVGANGGTGVGPNVAANWATAPNQKSCATCHVGADTAGHPGTVTNHVIASNLAGVSTCASCHKTGAGTTAAANGDAHNMDHNAKIGCVDCHAVEQSVGNGRFVHDNNNGVRAVVGEFTKWSHHIVNPNGAAPKNEQCAVCHLEGTVVGGELHVDPTKHVVDAKTHLRNADDDSDLQWDPANPNHTTMDNFCMSCHDGNGATSTGVQAIQALINANGNAMTGIQATAGNPFGDTISNRYDKMKRPAVTNVNDQFNTTNNSHHGVKGPRYSGRTRASASRQIASAVTFAANSTAILQGIRSTIYDAGNFNALYVPLANAEGEAAPRTGAQSLGDDSTLHCGDCHTVGQWAPNVATNAAGVKNTVAIGAHGSANEYMLRNSIGSDERHTSVAYTGTGVITVTNPNAAFLVCYNCHSYNKYGSVFVGTGLDAANQNRAQMDVIMPHAGEYASGGRCNGPGNTIPFNGYTTGSATDGTQFETRVLANLNFNTAPASYTGEQNGTFASGVNSALEGTTSESMNIFGIQCLNCHNSGIGNAYGGIHGSANNTSWNDGTNTITPDASVTGGAYIDGRGYTTKVERFLPGLGNVMHVPGTLGNTTANDTAKITNDTNWEQKHWSQTATTQFNYATGATANTAATGAGCYTLGEGAVATNVSAGLKGPSVTGPAGADTEVLDTWGGCVDHSAGQGGGNHGFIKRIVRPITY